MFTHKIFEKKMLQNILCYFHKFSVQYHLCEHFCIFEQFFAVSGFVCVVLIYFFFIVKREPLVCKSLIESAVAKQKKVRFCFLQIILPVSIFYHH